MYNYGYGMGTGCGVNTGCAPAPMSRYAGYPMVGADPGAEEGLVDKTKRILGEENSLVGIKNGYILGAAVAAGVAYYGYTHRWF